MSSSRSRVDRDRARPTTRSVSRGRNLTRQPLDSRSASPEPTTANGTIPGRAPLDTPSPGREPPELGTRNRRPPKKYSYYAGQRRHSRSLSIASKRARARKARREASAGTINNDGDHDGDEDPEDEGDNRDANASTPSIDDAAPAASDSPGDELGPPEPTVDSQCEKRARVIVPSRPQDRSQDDKHGSRARTSREHDRSPSPASSDFDPNETQVVTITTGETPEASQYTWIYETVTHKDFLRYAAARLQAKDVEELQNSGTENVVQMLKVVEKDSPPKVGSSRGQTKVVLFPQSVGKVTPGGWHHRHMLSHINPPATVTGKRQSPSVPDDSGNATKRSRPSDDDTATESETDDDVPPPPPAARVAPPILSVGSSRPGVAQPNMTSTSHTTTGTQARPPTRDRTLTTVLDSPRSTAQSEIGYEDLLPLIPNLDLPPRDPVHFRLRTKLLARNLAELESSVLRLTERVQADQACRTDIEGGSGEIQDDAMDEDEREEVKELDTSNPPPTPPFPSDRAGPLRYPKTPGPPKRTYGQNRTHLASESETNAPTPVSRPNSPSADPDALLDRERALAILEHARSERESRSVIARRTHAPATTLHTSSLSSTWAPTGFSASRSTPRASANRRLDPVSAARADMVAFNQEIARGNATSFVESATRANRQQTDEVAARCGPIRDRSAQGLLADNKEELARAQASAQGTYPKPTRARRRRIRKKKPLARDSVGIARQILVVAKVHLFAYALMEGIYQTRATFLKWAELIHFKTWELIIEDLPYVAATASELEVLVNYLATLRGKVKERLRPLIAEIHRLQHRVANQQDIQNNLDSFNQAYPNSFHCASMSPRRGHYESPHIARIIGAGLGYGPTSVIVQFPGYFEDLMPITVVAFILALWQFCLEEWSNGFFESRELGAAHMLDKYEAHLAGLKELRSVAPRRFERLQHEWSQYVKDYTGASFVRTPSGQVVTDRSELRPDSPVPELEQPSVEQWEEHEQQLAEEYESRMIRDARIASLRSLEQHTRDLDELDANDSCAEVPHSRSPSPTPDVEYDSNGRLTARSKGKGRAI